MAGNLRIHAATTTTSLLLLTLLLVVLLTGSLGPVGGTHVPDRSSMPRGPVSASHTAPSGTPTTVGALSSFLAPSALSVLRHSVGGVPAPIAPPGSGPGSWIDVTGRSTQFPLDNQFLGNMAPLPNMGETVLFGGQGYPGGIFHPNTWAFSNGTWTNVTSLSSSIPSPRQLPGMAYDPSSGKVVLYGGCLYFGGGVGSDTWSFSGNRWTNVTGSVTGAPPPACYAEMATDYSDNQVVLFNIGNTHGLYPWTYAYQNGVWTNLTTTAGTPPEFHVLGAMAEDPSSGGVLLFGGQNMPHFFSDTWLFVHDHWYNVTSEGTPLFRTFYNVLAGDEANGVVLLPPCFDYDSGFVTDSTFAWTNGTGWANWTARSGSLPFMYGEDGGTLPNGQGVLLQGGLAFVDQGGDQSHFSNRTWVFAPSLSIAASVAPTVAEPGAPVGFSAGFSGGLFTSQWGWTFSDGYSYPGWTTFTRVWDRPGTYAATFWARDAMGNTNSTTFLITVTQNLTAAASAAVAGVDAGQSVVFTGLATGGLGPYSYAWTFGDGGTSTALSPSHPYATPGSYVATLWVNDTLLYSASSSLTVTVAADPSVTIAAVGRDIQTGSYDVFSATPSGGTTPYTYLWEFGDGSTSALASPSHAYGSPGAHLVNLTLTDAAGMSATASIQINVTAPVAVSASTSPGGATVGATFSFTASASGGTSPYTYAWDFGDSSAGSSGASTTHAFTTPGNYTVRVTVTDHAGKTATATLAVTVFKVPEATTSGSGTSGAWPMTALLAVVALAVVAALFAVLFLMKGRKPRAPSGAGTEAPAPPPAPGSVPMEPAPTPPAAPPSYPEAPPPLAPPGGVPGSAVPSSPAPPPPLPH